MDWTDFDHDGQSTLVLSLSHQPRPRRAADLADGLEVEEIATPAQRLRGRADLRRLAETIPPDCRVTILADRGFGDQKLFAFLTELDFAYVIRFRGVVLVEQAGEQRAAKDWLSASGRARKLAGARVTGDRTEVGAVVVVHDKKMKEPWILATSLRTATAAAIVKLYGRRFTIEETFRDQKDLRFGLGLRATHIRSAARRDRFLFLLAIAQVLLTLLDAASERSGLDVYLRASTVKRRTHSLFRQGTYWYRCIPTMRDDWFDRLMAAYVAVLQEQREMLSILGAI